LQAHRTRQINLIAKKMKEKRNFFRFVVVAAAYAFVYFIVLSRELKDKIFTTT